MKHTLCCRMVVAAILAAALPVFAAVKTVTWSLPEGWAEDAVYPVVEGYRAIAGIGLEARSGVGEVAEPDLPYCRIRIAMPSNGSFGSVTADVEWEPVDLGGALPLPIAQPVPTGSEVVYPAPGAAYQSVYPATVAKTEFLQIVSGVRMMPIVVTPFKWDGPAKTLYRAKTLTVTATFDVPDARRLSLSSASQASQATQTALRSMALSMTVNPEDATAASAGLRLSSAAAGEEANADYVIVSPHRFVDLWKEFAKFRKTTEIGKSHTFFVKDCDEIYEEFKDVNGDDALKIHRYIERLYDNGSGKIQYVLLGAAAKKYSYDNQTMVPARYVVCGGSLSQMLDMYYGCMDRLPVGTGVEVWDYDGDGAYLGHKNANGSYSQDSNAYIDWGQDLAVFRFPLMEEVVEAGVKLTAGEIMTNFIAKIRRVESDAYPDRYSAILTGSTGFSSSGRGTASRTEMYGLVVDEREFFDQGLNLFDPAHPSSGSDSEFIPRDHNFEFLTYLRGNRKVLMNNSSYSTCTYMDIFKTSGDFLDTVCHGWARGAVGAVSSEGSFKATGIYTIYDCAVPCDTGMYDYCPGGSYGITNCICVGEAPILAPNGGALASINNTRYGWSASWTTSYGVSELGMAGQHSGRLSWLFMRALSGVKSWSEGKGYQPMDAGMALMWAHNMHGTPYASAAWGLSGAQVTGQGDPLAQLSVQHPRVWSPAGGSTVWSTNAANWSIAGKNGLHKFDVSRDVSLPLGGKGDQTFDVDGTFSAAALYVGQDEDATLTLDNTNGIFKVLRETVVTNGNICWKAAGGFGRNGIKFEGAKRGNITLPGNAKRYFGEKFLNVGLILVSGGNVVIDTPRKATFDAALDYDEIAFVATDAADVAEWNTLRSRNPGIFKADKRLPVVNSKLILQTYNIGGRGSGNSGKPLVFATNSTIKVQANPLWKEEYFVRPTYLHDSTLIGDYANFAFGPNDNTGYDIYVSGKCAISGSTPIRLNGTLRVHFLDENAELEISNPLCDGGATGSVVFDGTGKVTITAAQTFTGAFHVPTNVTVVAAVADAFKSAVVVDNGGTLKLSAIPLSGLPSLSVETGGALHLPAPTYTGTYKIVDATTTTLAIDPAATVYDEKGDPLEGEVTQGHFVLATDQLVWQASGRTWDLDPENVTAWKTESGSAAPYVDNSPLKFGDLGAGDVVSVLVGTNVAPGFVNFQNTTERYFFQLPSTLCPLTPAITFNSLIAATPITFEVPLNVPGGIMATGGSAQFGDVTTPKVEIAGGARVRATGTVQIPSQKVKKMRFEFSETRTTGNRAAINELRLFNASGRFYLPIGTVIRDIAGQQITVLAGTQGDGGQPVAGNIGDEQLSALIDGNLGGGNKWWASKSGSPTWFEITFPEPVEAVTGYSIRTADQEARDPKDWKVYAGFDDERMSLVATETGITHNTRRDWMKKAGASPSDRFPIGKMSGLALVRQGGELVLDGTWCDDLDLKSGAVLKVVGTNSLSAYNDNNSLYLPSDGTVAIDLAEADLVATAFPILTGFNLTAEQFGKFECATETAMLLLKDGDIYAATDNVAVPPYTATVSGNANWSTLAFTDKNTNSFTWANSNVKASGAVTLDVTADTILTMDAVGTIASLTITGSGKLTVNAADGITPIAPAIIDDSAHTGALVWNLPIGSTAVEAGKDMTIGGRTPGTGLLTVGAGMKATLGEGVTFANRNIDKAGWLRFEGTREQVDVGGLADANYSFEDALLVGSFERAGLTVKSAAGDCVRLIGTNDNFYGRSLINYDISGGLVELVPNGESCWFGQTATVGSSAATTFTQSGGIFRCLADGTGSGSGLLLGYQGGMDEGGEINVTMTGGLFEVPGSFLNFGNPTVFMMKNGARLRAKGFASTMSKGAIELGEENVLLNLATLEIGSLGFQAGAATIRMRNGTEIVGTENGSYISGDVVLYACDNKSVDILTFAATNGAQLALRGLTYSRHLRDDGSLLNDKDIVVFGNAAKDYTGEVVIESESAFPKRWKVAAGTVNVGKIRAQVASTLIERPMNGKIVVVLTEEEYVSGASCEILYCDSWANGLGSENLRQFVTVLVDYGQGEIVEDTTGTLRCANGVVEFLPAGAAGYLFPISATASGFGLKWTELDWRDRNGVKYTNDWAGVISAELVCSGNAYADVTMDRSISMKRLTTRVSGDAFLALNAGDNATLTLTDKLDDSASTGTTQLHITLGAGMTVSAGRALMIDGAKDTTTEHGKLIIGANSQVTVNNGYWNGEVEMADSTATLYYSSGEDLAAVPSSQNGTSVGTITYSASIVPADRKAQFGSTSARAVDGTYEFIDGTIAVDDFLSGLGNNTIQTFFVKGGEMNVAKSIVLSSDAGSKTSFYLNSGTLNASNATMVLGKQGKAIFTQKGGEFRIGGITTDGVDNNSGLTLVMCSMELGSGGIDIDSSIHKENVQYYPITMQSGAIVSTHDTDITIPNGIGVYVGITFTPAANTTVSVHAPLERYWMNKTAQAGSSALTVNGAGRVVLHERSDLAGTTTTATGYTYLKSGTLRLARRGLLGVSRVQFDGGKMEVLLSRDEAVQPADYPLFMTTANASKVSSNAKVLVAETGSEVDGAFSVSGNCVYFKPTAITGITADIKDDTDCDWAEAPWKDGSGKDVPASVWSQVVGTATLKNVANTRLAFSGACTISTLNINNSGVLDLIGGGTMTATTVDDSASTGMTKIGAFLKPQTLKAGRDTAIAERGDYTVTVGAGKKLTIPGWTTPSKVSGAGVVAIDMGARDTLVGNYWTKAGGVTGTNQIVRGTWEFSANSQYPNGKEILVSGKDAVLRFKQNTDISGYNGCSGSLTVEGGAEFQVAMRDTFNRTLYLRNGGKMLMTADKTNGNRAFDFFSSSALVVGGFEPCVVGGTAQTVSAACGDPIVNSGIVAIRRSGFPLTVDAGAHLDVYSQWGGVDSTGNAWTKKGVGTLVFYRGSGQTGTMTISDGLVRLVNNGQGTKGGIVNNAQLEIVASNGFTKTMANAISGTGALVKTGAGTLVLSGANVYSGATLVKDGTLRLGGTSALSPNSAVTLAAGTTLDLGTVRPTLPIAVGGSVRATVTQAEKSGEQWFTLFTVAMGAPFEAERLAVYDIDGETELADVEKRIDGQEVQIKCSEYKMPIVLLNNSEEARKWTEADWCDFNNEPITPAKWGKLSGRPKLVVEISAYVDTTLAIDTNLLIASFAVKQADGVTHLANGGNTFQSKATDILGTLQIGAAFDLGTVSGNGMLIVTNAMPKVQGLDDANWTGTVKLKDVVVDSLDVGALANDKSLVVLEGVSSTGGITVPSGITAEMACGANPPIGGPAAFEDGSVLKITMSTFAFSAEITDGVLTMDPVNTTLYVNGVLRPTGTWSVNGGTIELPITYPLTATATGNADWAQLTWHDADGVTVPAAFWDVAGNDCDVVITADVAVVLTRTAALSIGKVTVNGAGAVTLPTNLALTKLMGNGTVVVNGTWTPYAGVTESDWTGCLKLAGNLPEAKNLNFNTLGNAGSRIEIAGTMNGGYVVPGGACPIPICVSGTFHLSNGNSGGNNGYTFSGKLTGAGTVKVSGGPKDITHFTGDTSEFTGAAQATNAGGQCLAFGELADDDKNLGRIVVSNRTVRIATGKTWTAANGLRVMREGVLVLTPGAAVPVAGGAMFDAGTTLNVLADGMADSYAVSTGNLTLDAGTVLQFNGQGADREKWTVSGGMLVKTDTISADTTIDAPKSYSALRIEHGVTLSFVGAGSIDVPYGLTALGDGIVFDVGGIDGTNIAKYAVSGAPYSRWLARGPIAGTVSVANLPPVPKGYEIVSEVLPGYGVRLVVKANPAARLGAVSVNLRNGTAMEATDTASGIYGVPRKMWGDLQVSANNAVTVSNVTFALSGNVTAYQVNNTPPDAIQKQYMDDGYGRTSTITMSNIGYDKYRIIVYYSTDSDKINFQPIVLNDVYYSATPAGTTEKAYTIRGGKAFWGNTGPNHNAYAPCEGVNALVSDVMTDKTVTLKAIRGGSDSARATIAAIQIVKVGEVYTGPLEYEEKTLATKLSYVLPGTVTTQAYDYVYHPAGEDNHAWETPANWATVEIRQTKTGAIVTNYTPYAGAVAPALPDGSFVPVVFDGYTVTGEVVEGWVAQYGLYHGADVTINHLKKFQRGGTAVQMFVAVDENSRFTVRDWWTSGNSDANVNFHVAAPSGIVFMVNYNRGTAVNYYLAGGGSVVYEKGFTGTHTLKSATIELGDAVLAGKKIVRKYLVVGTGTTVDSSGLVVAGGSRKDSAVVKDDAFGMYHVGSDGIGTYIEWVAHTAIVMDPADVPEVIPVDNTNSVKIVTTWTNEVGETAKLDLTPAYTLTKVEGGVKAELNPAGEVVVGSEPIKVTPELTDAEEEDVKPLVVGDDVAVGVKTIPGLTYLLLRGNVPGDYPDVAARERAQGPRTQLTDTDKPNGKAFYVIQVDR